MLKIKEKQARDINQLKESEMKIESRIRSAHESYATQDNAEVKNLSQAHNIRRLEHLE